MFKHTVKHTSANSFLYIFLFCIVVLFICGENIPAQQNFSDNKWESTNINGDTIMQKITFRPEHIAFNVENPVADAQWFVDNLGFKIMYKGDPPGNTRFVADEKNDMMMELYNNTKFPKLNIPNVSYMAIHFAFMADSIEQVKEKLLAAGATLAEDIQVTAAGDKVLMLRTPWGLPIQFVERANPMLKYSFFRPEHFAINLPDPVEVAKWLVENMGMKIIRQGGAPAYTTFIADENENMMFELFNNVNYPSMDFKNTSYMALHIAFMVNDMNAVKTKLLSAGATIAEDLNTTANGTQVLVLRGPDGLPFQFIKRPVPMIK
jgi:catechol 2,3-dioxygenase-like lactoylglutathione lyase family enzyme